MLLDNMHIFILVCRSQSQENLLKGDNEIPKCKQPKVLPYQNSIAAHTNVHNIQVTGLSSLKL